MKYVLFLIAFLLAGCASQKKVEAPRIFREVTVHLHADKDMNPYRRGTLDLAASKVRKLTNNRGFITIDYDLDFDSAENLQHHVDRQSSILIDVPGDGEIAQSIDRRHAGKRVLAETSIREGQRVVIAFMPERYTRVEDLRIAMHELGHAVGMDDTTITGCVMTGSSEPSSRLLTDFQKCDLVLCREAMLCD